ncbi:flagellar hook-length control protein FliK [Pseudomonas resinovorans]|uniref:Flagellar hook-length control protein FliK n=1 Tax=Metapseudomonas resinovorans TaxID=53412 RepID=A0ABT4Y450_METRE|nr:flagellar hook-length control protein FliK [Pseudomonas resinovorans]MDA8483504.1 flagellar hook-length control protein FliK [Pseudomonas resinovorans]
MTEISGTRPLPPTQPAVRPAQNPVDMALKLLQPLDGLLSAGESADAEVIALKETAQSFQVLLKLTLGNGSQTTLEASSPRPLVQGSLLNVTALSDTRLIMALKGGERALGSLDLDLLPVGTLVQGKVVSSELAAQGKAQAAVYKVLVNVLNTPLAGSQLNIESPRPLAIGSLLSAQVQGSQMLQFLPLATQLDQLELTQQLAGQQNRQGSLDALLSALQSTGRENLQDSLRAAMDKLLGALPDIRQLGDPKALAAALENSGALLESRLLAGQAGALPQDFKANLLRLIAQLLPALPTPTSLPTIGTSNAMAQALPAFIRSALGALGQANARQQALSFPLPSRLAQTAEEEGDLETLLKLAAAAVSRLQTHQLSSLAQTQVTPEGNLLTTWQLEVPMRNQQEIVPLQIKLQQEQEGKQDKSERKESLWRIELAFDLEPLGPLQVQAQLVQGSLSSQLWAERADTAGLIDRELPNLRDRLLAAGLTVGELACNQGKPPRGQRTQLEQRWVDETA